MRRAALLLGACALLVACTDSPEQSPPVELPPTTAFAEGTCRSAAPALRELAQLLPDLGEDGTLDADQQETLRDTQDELFALTGAVEPERDRALTDVVERIGGVRIRAAGNSYEPLLGEQLQESVDAMVADCTG